MKEVNEKVIKKIFINLIKAIVVILYFVIFNLIYEKIESNLLTRGIQICTMIFLFISIYIFEKSYKKDDGELAIQGIEILIFSSFILTMQYITNRFGFYIKGYSITISYIFGIYYVLKSIVIYTKGRKELASSYSDIREIVKKEEPVVKEATKRKKEVEEPKIEEKKEIKKQEKNKKRKKNKPKKKNKKKR